VEIEIFDFKVNQYVKPFKITTKNASFNHSNCSLLLKLQAMNLHILEADIILGNAEELIFLFHIKMLLPNSTVS
jgi:hypothetical protein